MYVNYRDMSVRDKTIKCMLNNLNILMYISWLVFLGLVVVFNANI